MWGNGLPDYLQLAGFQGNNMLLPVSFAIGK